MPSPRVTYGRPAHPMSEETCTCGHPGLAHRLFEDKTCLVADCPCNAFARKGRGKAQKYHADPVCTCGHQKSKHIDGRLSSCDQCWGCARFKQDYPSTAEWRRGQRLIELEREGIILQLQRQPRYDLTVDGKKVGAYVADFRYAVTTRNARGEEEVQVIIEDVKGFETKAFRLKVKLMQAIYGIDIRIIRD